jgi:hypothetical protein
MPRITLFHRENRSATAAAARILAIDIGKDKSLTAPLGLKEAEPSQEG